MAQRLDTRNPWGGTTDHSQEITRLRAVGTVNNDAAAALLECHDQTGISLDDWIGPREFVNQQLALLDFPPLLENGV